jgi:hypothetical protein
MWTYNKFPAEKVAQKYGFTPSQKWLDEARLSSVRLAGGCSGSFVSPDGLVMTNHHCAHRCIEQLSTAKVDFVKQGFYAPQAKDEVKCPEIELNQLLGIEDVTARIQQATKGLEGKTFARAQRMEMSRLEKECSKSDPEALRCEVITLYHGGSYDLYKYKRFQDVRLVFAPEFAIAFFGGDPDNFEFPRYDLDVSFLRAYENGKPAHTEHHFKWSPRGAAEGALTFVSGNPGGTDRDLTVSELEYERDVALPDRIFSLAEYRGALTQFTKRDAESYRIGEAELFGVENSYKALRGRLSALLDPKLLAEKRGKEQALRAQVAQDPEEQKKWGQAWDQIAESQSRLAKVRKELLYLEKSERGGGAVRSRLFDIARTLVRWADESQKPNGERLREYRDSALPSLKHRLFSEAPIYPQLETFRIAFALTKMREELGPDHVWVKRILGKKSPEQLAQELVAGTRMADVALRKKLFAGGKQALDEVASDAMVQMVRLIEPEALRLRHLFDDEINAQHKRAAEMVAKARFQHEGAAASPDATFTLRLSYGTVRGYEVDGKRVDPITTMGGAFDRATGEAPFQLPESWVKAQQKLRASTPMNFCTDNDIIGGNSGSPVIDKDLQVVGLIFDGNIQSLGGDFYFDESQNRAVAVHSEALLEALDKIYDARRVVDELRPTAGGGAHPSGMR